jgi:hypothetical protein
LLNGVGGGMPGLGGGAYVVRGTLDFIVVACKGVYASLERGLEPSGELALALGVPVGPRKGCRGRGDRGLGLDDIAYRSIPATGFDWTC